MTRLVRFVHFQKAKYSILVTDEGIVIPVRLVQLENVS
jgi:hypothetical protein